MTPAKTRNPEKKQKLATIQDLDAALAGLTSLELVKLGKSRDILCKGSEYASGLDLLGEAIFRAYRAAEGETEHFRAWPTDTPIQAFLLQTMRSLAHGSRHSSERADTFAFEAIAVDGTSAEWVLGDAGHFNRDHLSEAFEQEEIKLRDSREEAQLRLIEDLFRGDVEIECYLEGVKADLSPASIRDACNWTETEYNTIRTRFRRKLKKISP